MPSENFDLSYNAKVDKAVSAIDRLMGKIGDLDKLADKSEARLKNLGNNTPGLMQAMSSISKLGQALALLDSLADKAKAAVAGVGTNTSGMTQAETKAAALDARLKQIEADAKAAAASLASIKPPPGGIGGGVPVAGGSGGGVGSRLASIAMSRGAHVFRAGAKAVGDAGQTERSRNTEMAEKAIAFRESLLERATLEDKTEVDDDLMRQQLDFQSKTGMSVEEASTFANQYKGAITSGKLRGNITDKVADELMPEVGMFGIRTGMDAETTGKLGGLLGEFGNIPSAEAGMNTLGQMQYHMNKLGVGSMKQLGRPLLGLMGEMVDEDGGRVADPVKMSAMYAASSIRSGSPAKAATQIRQANRVLRKMADSGVAGVNDEDDYWTALNKAAPHITGKNGDQWLKEQGFKNDAENQGLIKQARLIPVVEAELKDPRAAEFGRQAMAHNRAYLASPSGRARTAEANQYKTEVTSGMKSDRVEMERKEAEARLKDPNRPGGPAIDTTATGITDAMTYGMNFGGVYGRDERIDQEAMRDLKQRAIAAGVSGRTKLPSGVELGDAFASAEATSGSGRGIQSAVKGTPTSVDERRREVIQETSKLVEAAEKLKAAAQMQMDAAKAGGRPMGPIPPQGGMPGVAPKR